MRNGADNDSGRCNVPEAYKERLQALQSRLRIYQTALPATDHPDTGQLLPAASLEDALPDMEQAIESWVGHVRMPAKKIRVLQTRLFESRFLLQCLCSIADDQLRPETFKHTVHYRPVIGTGYAQSLEVMQQDARVLMEMYPLPHEDKAGDEADTVFVALFPAADSAEFERGLRAIGVRFAKIPPGLHGSPQQALKELEHKLLIMEKHLAALQSKIDWYAEKDQIRHWQRQLQRWVWLTEVMQAAACDTHFVQVCGWMPDKKRPQLEAALQDSGGPYLLQTGAAAPEHGEPPVLLDNAKWLRPFENFVRGFGVPGANEIDPTPVLAVTTPLMFGYMFGDVGQGLVLALLGYLLQHRLPVMALFIPAGISAMLFGVLYGSVFSYEGLIPPLWLHPMHEPLTVMGLALMFGAALLITSLLLAAVQSYWDGCMQRWLTEKLPLLVLAVAIPVLFLHPAAGLTLMLMALLITVLTAGKQSGYKGALTGVLKLVEDGVQLAMNMLSFIRLGAFTLAHGGLSAAVMVLTMMPDNLLLRLLIFVAGNALVIALEGLVVSIQTTRLVMFEFFRRFLQGTGRPFKPLTDPAMS
jgi:V/A-type H+-transporting ATPase subunit I